MTDAVLPFTGERFTPESVREIWYEHWHRYVFARSFAREKRVLDAACGEGYGSALLASVAGDVVGIDIDAQAIEHARQRYWNMPRLRYQCGDATALPFDDGVFDVIVSFETLEHLEQQEELIAGFARVLTDDGVLLLSTPDKRTYSDASGFRNEFHVRELYREELMALLQPHFPHLHLYGQKLLFQSALWSLQGDHGAFEVAAADASATRIEDGFAVAPLYLVVVCSRQPLPELLPSLSLFGDADESVYAHYNHEVRKNIEGGARIVELEAEIERLRAGGIPSESSSVISATTRKTHWWQRREKS